MSNIPFETIQARLDEEFPSWGSAKIAAAANGGIDVTMRRLKVTDTHMSQLVEIVDRIMQEEGFIGR